MGQAFDTLDEEETEMCPRLDLRQSVRARVIVRWTCANGPAQTPWILLPALLPAPALRRMPQGQASPCLRALQVDTFIPQCGAVQELRYT